MATEFVTAIKTSEIPVGAVTAIDVRGTRIAAANVGGAYYAFDDECTHEQCSLAEEGELAGTTLTCTCHGSEFDVRTGKVLAPPATRGDQDHLRGKPPPLQAGRYWTRNIPFIVGWKVQM